MYVYIYIQIYIYTYVYFYMYTYNIYNTNFCGSNMPGDKVEHESFIIHSIDSFLVYESKYYLQVY